MPSGTYDIGVETLIAESFHIAERRTVCTYAATGAETRCYRVLTQGPQPPAAARRGARHPGPGRPSLINEQTQRAAVQIHATSLMDDDGSVEIRTRLIRPMTSRRSASSGSSIRTGEKPRAKNSPLVGTPNAPSVPGILREQLLHHHRLAYCRSGTGCSSADMRVYRFETDDGERVIGRLITPEALAPLYQAFGVDSAPGLSHDEAWNAVLDRGAVLDLAGDSRSAARW